MGRRRHWIVDAALGGAVALWAMTMAHAARPKPDVRPPVAAVAAVTVATPPAAMSVTAEPSELIAFEQPVPGRPVVSPFGLRQMPWEAGGRLHAGVDISADSGTPILTAADGVVVATGHDGGYGRFVKMRHAEGLSTFYAHMGGVGSNIRAGTALKAGSPIGLIGSSGSSTGPHLHFEVRDCRDRPLNPAHFIGKAFAEADDLPLRAAARIPRRVRIATVSHIPESKRALMAARAADTSAPSEEISGAPAVTETADGRVTARL